MAYIQFHEGTGYDGSPGSQSPCPAAAWYVSSRDAVQQAYTLWRQSHSILAKSLFLVSLLSTAHNMNSFEPTSRSLVANNKELLTHGFVVWSQWFQKSPFLQLSCPPWKGRVVRSLTTYVQQRPWPPKGQWANSLDRIDRDRHVFHVVWWASPQFYTLMTPTGLVDPQSRQKLTSPCSSRQVYLTEARRENMLVSGVALRPSDIHIISDRFPPRNESLYRIHHYKNT